jgi:hypothetical protein
MDCLCAGLNPEIGILVGIPLTIVVSIYYLIIKLFSKNEDETNES